MLDSFVELKFPLPLWALWEVLFRLVTEYKFNSNFAVVLAIFLALATLLLAWPGMKASFFSLPWLSCMPALWVWLAPNDDRPGSNSSMNNS